MQPRVNVITLAVDDRGRAVAFYRDGLGLETPGVGGTEFAGDDTTPVGAVAMFQLPGGLILALYPRGELAKDANISIGPRRVVSSASATQSGARERWTLCSPKPRQGAQR